MRAEPTIKKPACIDFVSPHLVISIIIASMAGSVPLGTLAQPPSSSIGKCIRSGDETAINSVLSEPGARALLCPNAVFNILHSIVLSANGQELATMGASTEKSYALIRVANAELSSAIFSRASNISIHNVIVDGGKRSLGRSARGGALIEIGGHVDGIAVDHIRALDPRGWSTIHVFEGGLNCRGAKITNSVFGPAGSPDGAWADGISFACRDGVISHNVIVDASDGGIVIFGSPGTIVEYNVIKTENNTLLGGINLVDFEPFSGDYSGTIVRHNRILADGGYTKVGIALGPAVWGTITGQINRGARIEENNIIGDNIGFGIAADGVNNFVVTGNVVLAHPSGTLGPYCPKGQSSPGRALIRNPSTTEGTFQPEFEEGALLYAICIGPRT